MTVLYVPHSLGSGRDRLPAVGYSFFGTESCVTKMPYTTMSTTCIDRDFFSAKIDAAKRRQVLQLPPAAAFAAAVSLSGAGKTTPESKKGSPKVNVPSRQRFSQVKTVS